MSKKKDVEIEGLISEDYVPSSVERKKAVLMYFLLWIIIWINNKKLWKYEQYHMKQALWWWAVFIMLIVVSAFMVFVPYLRVVPIIILFVMLWIFVFFVKQAYEWFYTIKSDKIVLPFFYWIWWWIVDIFDVTSDEEQK